MIYRCIMRNGRIEIDVEGDLRARQFAMANRTIDQVVTETGRVVYRKAMDQMPDIDLDECFNTAKKEVK
jgi:hypothetical protein